MTSFDWHFCLTTYLLFYLPRSDWPLLIKKASCLKWMTHVPDTSKEKFTTKYIQEQVRYFKLLESRCSRITSSGYQTFTVGNHWLSRKIVAAFIISNLVCHTSCASKSCYWMTVLEKMVCNGLLPVKLLIISAGQFSSSSGQHAFLQSSLVAQFIDIFTMI